MLPDPPEVDRGSTPSVAAAGDPARPDPRRAAGRASAGRRPSPTSTRVGARSRCSARWSHRQAPGRHPDALLPHRHGHRALRGAGLQPAPRRRRASWARARSSDTIVAPIRRQEPGHYAFYKMSARGLAAQLAPWQRWLVRRMRTHLLRAGRRQQRRADGRLRRPDARAGHHHDLDTLRRARSPGSSASCCGRATRACGSPLRRGRVPRGGRAGAGRRRRAVLALALSQHPLGDPRDVVGRGGGRAEGCMTWLSTSRTTMSMAASRCGARGRRYGAIRSPTTILAPASSDSACVVSSGSSSVSAPCVAETTACSRALSWATRGPGGTSRGSPRSGRRVLVEGA